MPTRLTGEASSVERPAFRNYLGEIFATQRDTNHMELALGDNTRSGQQYDIWQAVFSPVGSDGYPKPIFDKNSGQIDQGVADYWRDHYDLTHIIERDWATLGAEAAGQAAYLCRHGGQLLPDQRGLLRAAAARGPEAGVGRDRGLWRSRRALLERRPQARQCLVATALQLSIPAAHPGADQGHRSEGRGPHELALS